jgi:stage V sporulation protein G
MNITDIRIFPVDEPKLKAFVSIIFDHSFIVSDIKVIEGTRGFFLSMPSKKRRDGTFKDIAHPLNAETRKMLEDEVIAAYNAEMAKNPKTTSAVEAGDMVPDLETPVVTDPAAQTTEAPPPESGAP